MSTLAITMNKVSQQKPAEEEVILTGTAIVKRTGSMKVNDKFVSYVRLARL